MNGSEYLGFRRPPNQKKTHQDSKRQKRQMGESCKSNKCRKASNRACNKISETVRKELFSFFWKDLDWTQIKVYVSNLVKKEGTKRKN